MRSLCLLVLAACEAFAPDAPGAKGELTLPSDDPSAYATVEVCVFADVDGHFDLAGPPDLPATEIECRSYALTPTVRFPLDYDVAELEGTSPHREWRVVAWLATADTQTWPNGSEPFATTTFTLDKYADGEYCGIITSVDLVLQRAGT